MSDPTNTLSAPARPRLTDTPRGQTIFVGLWVLGTLVTLGIWVGAFFWGQSVATPVDIAQPVEDDDVADVVIEFPEVGPPSVTPGTWEWIELRGGECIADFTGAFAEEFQVVGCSSVHTAQLLKAELLSSTLQEPYPGDAAVLAQARDMCDVRDLIDIEIAREYSDLRTAYSYPVDQAQWDAGQRGVYCFVYSESGASFTSSLR